MKRLILVSVLASSALSAFAANELRVAIPRLVVAVPSSTPGDTPPVPAQPVISTATLTAQSGTAFGTVAVNGSATLGFTFSNTGNTSLSGVYAQLTGTDLSLTSNTCGTSAAPTTMAVGASCTLSVTYNPSSYGSLSAAALAVTSSATGGPKSVSLSGRTPFQVQAYGGSSRSWGDGSFAVSCNAYRTATGNYAYAGATGSGLYHIDPDGPGGYDPYGAYCDMTSEGGGWTRVVLQSETTPLTMWETAGINGSSYVVRQHLMPAHSQVGFGRDGLATSVDYVTWTYTTGNIPLTTVSSPKTGKQYQVHRNSGQYYGRHDPEQGAPVIPSTRWYNTLTLDEVGTLGYNWAFAPSANAGETGYAFGGSLLATTYEGYAWTVWVR